MTSLPISLPDGFIPLVHENDSVHVNQTLARDEGGFETIINIPQSLGVSLDKARKVIKKNPGDFISSGDILATTRKFFGFEKREVISNVSGTVVRYERHTGNLVIRNSSTAHTQKIVSPVEGVVKVCNNKTIVIETKAQVLQGKNGVGEEITAEVFALHTSSLFTIDSKAIDKILVSHEITKEMLTKALGIGVKGIVGVHIEQKDIAYLFEKGKSTIPVIQVDQYGLSVLRDWHGKQVSIHGETKTIILL